MKKGALHHPCHSLTGPSARIQSQFYYNLLLTIINVIIVTHTIVNLYNFLVFFLILCAFFLVFSLIFWY